MKDVQHWHAHGRFNGLPYYGTVRTSTVVASFCRCLGQTYRYCTAKQQETKALAPAGGRIGTTCHNRYSICCVARLARAFISSKSSHPTSPMVKPAGQSCASRLFKRTRTVPGTCTRYVQVHTVPGTICKNCRHISQHVVFFSSTSRACSRKMQFIFRNCSIWTTILLLLHSL